MAKAKKETLAEKILDLQMINLNGSNYIGSVEKVEGGFELTDAVECSSSFETSIKNWIKADNMNSLQKMSCVGDGISVVTKDFTEQQKLEITIIASKADYAIKYAVKELENSKI